MAVPTGYERDFERRREVQAAIEMSKNELEALEKTVKYLCADAAMVDAALCPSTLDATFGLETHAPFALLSWCLEHLLCRGWCTRGAPVLAVQVEGTDKAKVRLTSACDAVLTGR